MKASIPVSALVVLSLSVGLAATSAAQNAAVKYLRADIALRQSYPLAPDGVSSLEQALESPPTESSGLGKQNAGNVIAVTGSTEREQCRTPRPPRREKGYGSLGAHPSDCDRLHATHSPESLWSNGLWHEVILPMQQGAVLS